MVLAGDGAFAAGSGKAGHQHQQHQQHQQQQQHHHHQQRQARKQCGSLHAMQEKYRATPGCCSCSCSYLVEATARPVHSSTPKAINRATQPHTSQADKSMDFWQECPAQAPEHRDSRFLWGRVSGLKRRTAARRAGQRAGRQKRLDGKRGGEPEPFSCDADPPPLFFFLERKLSVF